MTKPASYMTDRHVGRAPKPLRNRAGTHHIGGKDEHWHGQQHIAAVERVHDLIGGDAEILAGHGEIHETAADHRDAEWNLRQGQGDESHEQENERGRHRASSLAEGSALVDWKPARTRMPRARSAMPAAPWNSTKQK